MILSWMVLALQSAVAGFALVGVVKKKDWDLIGLIALITLGMVSARYEFAHQEGFCAVTGASLTALVGLVGGIRWAQGRQRSADVDPPKGPEHPRAKK